MRRIYQNVQQTRLAALSLIRVRVACESCNWTGRRAIEVVVDAGDWFDDMTTAAAVNQQRLAALELSTEMQSRPCCPKCGGDVYHAPSARQLADFRAKATNA